MKEPVLQDKYHHHVQFCKYGLELLERVTGAPLSPGSESLDLSKLTNVCILLSEIIYSYLISILSSYFLSNCNSSFLYYFEQKYVLSCTL